MTPPDIGHAVTDGLSIYQGDHEGFVRQLGEDVSGIRRAGKEAQREADAYPADSAPHNTRHFAGRPAIGPDSCRLELGVAIWSLRCPRLSRHVAQPLDTTPPPEPRLTL